jgi:hypothetical protein
LEWQVVNIELPGFKLSLLKYENTARREIRLGQPDGVLQKWLDRPCPSGVDYVEICIAQTLVGMSRYRIFPKQNASPVWSPDRIVFYVGVRREPQRPAPVQIENPNIIRRTPLQRP